MFITLLIVDGKWNPKTEALVLLTIGTLSLFLLKFFMKQMDGALKQDCLGVNNKHHTAETWDLEFVFQTPQKVFSNTTKNYSSKIISYGFLLYSPTIWLDLKSHFHSREKVKFFETRSRIIFLALTWRDEIEIIIRPFSYFETRTRLNIVTLMFWDEIETLENHFSWPSEKNEADSRREFPGSRILGDLCFRLILGCYFISISKCGVVY